MERLYDILTAFCILLVLVVLRSVRRQHIRVEYSVSWLGAALTFFVILRFPHLLESAGRWLGFSQLGEGLLFLILLVFLGVLYRLSVVISSLRDNNIALAQRVAILEFQLRSAHEERQTPAA
jgi:hypothetical protein